MAEQSLREKLQAGIMKYGDKPYEAVNKGIQAIGDTADKVTTAAKDSAKKAVKKTKDFAISMTDKDGDFSPIVPSTGKNIRQLKESTNE